jgi:micrococcal nuclease
MRALAVLLLAASASCTQIAAPTATSSPPVTAAPPSAVPAIAAAPRKSFAWPGIPRDAIRAHVPRVVDGDTIVLIGITVGYAESGGRPGRHARLIGINTPEVFGRLQCFGPQASAFTKRELTGRDVFVDFDVERLDRYGRALVYVWTTDGAFFNGELAQDGYAVQETIPPDVRYAEDFARYVSDARTARRGLWSAC